MKIGLHGPYNEQRFLISLRFFFFGATQKPYGYMHNNSIKAMLRTTSERLPKPKGTPEGVYNLMLSTWTLAPEERPTAIALASTLADMVANGRFR